MSKTISVILQPNTEKKLEEIEDEFNENSRSHVIRRIIKEYYDGKNSYKYLTDDDNEQ